MKVFHINSNFLGTELHQNLIVKLDEMGLDNLVYVAAKSLESSFPIVVRQVIKSKCFNEQDRFFFHVKQKKIYKDIVSRVNICQFDCIHAYTLFTDGNNARRLSKEFNIPYIVTIRSTDIDVFFKYVVYLRKLGIRIMRDASKIVFLSNAAKETVFSKYVPSKYYDELSTKALVVPNGIDDYWFNNLHPNTRIINDRRVNLISVGKINKNKNFLAVLASMKELKKHNISATLTVIGKVEDESVLKQIMDDHNAVYHKAIPKEELIDYYRKNDIFVLPSFVETFGLVYAEALSQGLPIVYSQGQGFDKQFDEGVVGFHVNPKDPSDIAKAIENIISNYVRIATETTISVRKFNWELIASQYVSIYRNLIELE